MSSNYYYIYSFLPEIQFKEGEDYTRFSWLFEEVMDLLSPEDCNLIKYIRFPIDNTNLVSILEKDGMKFLAGGNYTQGDLLYEIKTQDSVPAYMDSFLEYFKKSEMDMMKRGNIHHLNNLFYGETIEQNKVENFFLKRWFVFERDLDNVLTALECRKHNEPIERRVAPRVDQRPGQRLTGDYEVTDHLLRSKSLDFNLSGTHPWMMRVLDFNSSNPVKYERDILLLKLEVLQDLAGEENFSIETILAYFIRLQILIRWSRLNKDQGSEFIGIVSRQTDRHIKDAFAY